MQTAKGNSNISRMRCTCWCRAAVPSAIAGEPTTSCQVRHWPAPGRNKVSYPYLSPSALESAQLRPDVTSPVPEQWIDWPLTFERGGCFCAGEYLFPEFVNPEEEAQLIHMLDHEEPAWRDTSFNGKYRWGHVPLVLQSYCRRAHIETPNLVAACDPVSRAVC